MAPLHQRGILSTIDAYRAVLPAACALFVLPAVATEVQFAYEDAWALSGLCCGDSGHDIAVERDGSFFIVGDYGALDLDLDGTVDLQSEGGHDAILVRGRPAGSLQR